MGGQGVEIVEVVEREAGAVGGFEEVGVIEGESVDWVCGNGGVAVVGCCCCGGGGWIRHRQTSSKWPIDVFPNFRRSKGFSGCVEDSQSDKGND